MSAAHAWAHFRPRCPCRGFSSQWDTFMHQITPFATKMPYQVLLGNHEANGWGFGKFARPQQVDSGW